MMYSRSQRRNQSPQFGYSLLLIVVLLLNLAQGQKSPEQPKPEMPAWLKSALSSRVVYSVPGMDRVKVEKDITYKQAGSIQLKMDVYRPPNLAKTDLRPAVIFIHGGYLPVDLPASALPREWGVFISYGRLMAASGLVGVTFNHRLFGSFNALPDSQADIADLITYVRDHAVTLGIDKDHLTLWFFSGAGALMCNTIRDPQPYVRSVIAYYTILDLNPMRKDHPETASEEIARNFSPISCIESAPQTIAPMLVGRAGLDSPALNNSLDQFVQAALTRNWPVEVINHPQGHHGFDARDDNDRSREIIRATLQFIREH